MADRGSEVLGSYHYLLVPQSPRFYPARHRYPETGASEQEAALGLAPSSPQGFNGNVSKPCTAHAHAEPRVGCRKL